MTEPNPLGHLDPSKDSPADYAAAHQRAGHICCACPNQDPPFPCCNPGHDEAMRLVAEFRQITDAKGQP